jgi:phosphoesterase RecJ-like protein
LIISLGATDLKSHDHLFHSHADFFFATPIINIDHSPANEHFGQLNLVDTTATAVAEVCHNFLHLIDPELLDEEIATCFLAGMIAKTKSFKTPNVTPRTLKTASVLMSKGAKRDLIVENLFRTRSVETLRLWGRALARLKSQPESKIVWTLLSKQDFMHAGATEADLPDVVDELITSSPEAKVVVLLYEDNESNICAVIRAEQPHDAMALAASFRPAGTREEAKLCFLDKTIVEVERDLISKLKIEIKR